MRTEGAILLQLNRAGSVYEKRAILRAWREEIRAEVRRERIAEVSDEVAESAPGPMGLGAVLDSLERGEDGLARVTLKPGDVELLKGWRREAIREAKERVVLRASDLDVPDPLRFRDA